MTPAVVVFAPPGKAGVPFKQNASQFLNVVQEMIPAVTALAFFQELHGVQQQMRVQLSLPNALITTIHAEVVFAHLPAFLGVLLKKHA